VPQLVCSNRKKRDSFNKICSNKDQLIDDLYRMGFVVMPSFNKNAKLLF